MNRFNKKLITEITSIFGVLSLGLTTGIPFVSKNDVKSNNLFNDSNKETNDENSEIENVLRFDDVKPLVPLVSNFENAKLVTKQGPIIFWGDTIKSLDWFGAERWSVDLTKLGVTNKDGQNAFPSTYGTDIKRSWVNWEIDRKNNKLWIVSNIALSNNWNDTSDREFKHQYLVSIDTNTGEHIDTLRGKRNNGRNDVYRNISVLSDGSPVIYGLGFSLHKKTNKKESSTFVYEKFNVAAKDSVVLSSDEIGKKFDLVEQENLDGMDYIFNIIPIAENRNMFFTVKRANIRSSTDPSFKNDVPFEQTSAPNINLSKRDMSITCVLLDDNLNKINGNSEWANGNLVKIIGPASNKFKNKYTFPQRDWYRLLDGRIVTIIYDNLIIIDPSNPDNPKRSSYKIGTNDGDWVESYTFDTNEDIFYKLYGSSEIRKLTLDKTKNNNHLKTLYYDLKNSSPEIKKHATSFSIYNVTGYSGQIMIINSYFDGYNSSRTLPNQNDIETNEYGLAAAIINNKNSDGEGDTKGLLNTKKAFQKSADFNLKSNVLDNKLPSEIGRNDLDLLNNSFFTKRTEIENGQLKYKPFVKTKMDDIKKELEVVVNLDQIPWFVTDNKMPNDIKPLVLKKSFISNVDISTRFTWKKSNVDDYDFKNTLPSKVTLDDVKRISPLVSTMSSRITTLNGEKYPKTNYKIESFNDDTGEIKISANYQYLPIDTDEKKENIKTYTTEKIYTIFKNGDSKKFSFVTENSQNQSIANIDNIPALKELKEANLFPSYFKNSSNKQEFLKFINISETSGYPLEKMNISVDANDDLGTLKVIVDPTSYDVNLPKQMITYNGLNKRSSYKFVFNTDPIDFNKKSYRPSDITDEILFDNFIKYSGFDSSDLDVSLTPNNTIGNLIVDIFFILDYPKSILDDNGFHNVNGVYKRTETISGFKTNSEFNSEYQLIFKNDLDNSLIKIKELTPAVIKAKLDENNLVVDGTKYNNIFELANLFISSKGVHIPEINETNKNKINIEMYTNNPGGEITFNITFSSLDGYPNSITFIQKFTGFGKGNDIITNDVLTFKDSNQLQITEKDLLSKMPSQVKKEFTEESKKEMIYKFLSGTPTGDYKKSIDINDFELDIVADDNYGFLTINIKFRRESIHNKDSLLEYSQTFTGFNHY